MNFKIGCKYQIYEPYSDNDKTLYRLIRANNSKSAVFVKCGESYDNEFNKATEEINGNMIEIQPDALLHIMWTKYDNGDDDIYVRVFKTDNLNSDTYNDNLALIMRQDCVSQLKSMFAGGAMKVYVGECLTKDTLLDPEMKLTDLYEFDHVEDDMLIYLYCDDTLEDIVKLIGSKSKVFDKVFETLYKKNSDVVEGYAYSLVEFLEENSFIDAFRNIYGIIPIDIPIVLGKESYNADGDIILNNKQKTRLEDILRKHIKDIKILEYDYDLDIASIISYSHIMVSDINEKIYLITFTIVDQYPIDDDIANAMMH